MPGGYAGVAHGVTRGVAHGAAIPTVGCPTVKRRVLRLLRSGAHCGQPGPGSAVTVGFQVAEAAARATCRPSASRPPGLPGGRLPGLPAAGWEPGLMLLLRRMGRRSAVGSPLWQGTGRVLRRARFRWLEHRSRPTADGAPQRDVRYPSLCCPRTAPGRLPEWPKGAVCKTVGLAYVGSNPTPATIKLAGQTRSVGPGLVRCGSGLRVPLPRSHASVAFPVRAGQGAVSTGSGWRHSSRCCRAWLSSG